jgi:WD repeat-containing protein 23
LLANRNAAANLLDDDNEDDEYVPDDDDDEDEDDFMTRRRYMSRRQRQWIPPATEPQAAGVELLNSGDFGYLGPKHKAKPNLSNVTRSILGAASKPPSYVSGEEIKTVGPTLLSYPFILTQNDTLQNFVPNTNGTTVATYDANIYTAQFSGGMSAPLLRLDSKSDVSGRFVVLLHLRTR